MLFFVELIILLLILRVVSMSASNSRFYAALLEKDSSLSLKSICFSHNAIQPKACPLLSLVFTPHALCISSTFLHGVGRVFLVNPFDVEISPHNLQKKKSINFFIGFYGTLHSCSISIECDL